MIQSPTLLWHAGDQGALHPSFLHPAHKCADENHPSPTPHRRRRPRLLQLRCKELAKSHLSARHSQLRTSKQKGRACAYICAYAARTIDVFFTLEQVINGKKASVKEEENPENLLLNTDLRNRPLPTEQSPQKLHVHVIFQRHLDVSRLWTTSSRFGVSRLWTTSSRFGLPVKWKISQQ